MIVLALTGAVLFVLVPALRARADAVPHIVTLADRLPLVAAPAVASALLAVALALAIFKPSWRIRE
jgi:hypothetical protein